jgi:hypothetical protein
MGAEEGAYVVGVAELGINVGTSVGGSVTGVHDIPMVKHIRPDGHSRGTLRPVSVTIKGQGKASGLVLHSSVASCHPLPQNMFCGLSRLFLKLNSSSVGAGVGTVVKLEVEGAKVALSSVEVGEGAMVLLSPKKPSSDEAMVEFASIVTTGEGAMDALEATDGANVMLDDEGARVTLVSLKPTRVGASVGGNVVFMVIEGDSVSLPPVTFSSLEPPRFKNPTLTASVELSASRGGVHGKLGPKQ